MIDIMDKADLIIFFSCKPMNISNHLYSFPHKAGKYNLYFQQIVLYLSS